MKLQVNQHGVVSLILVVSMLLVFVILGQPVSPLYLGASMMTYILCVAVASGIIRDTRVEKKVVPIEELRKKEADYLDWVRIRYGFHLVFLAWIIGMFLSVESLICVAYWIISALIALALPFMILKADDPNLPKRKNEDFFQ